MKKIILILSLLSLVYSLEAGVLSQWRGPQRTGHYPETQLMTSWPAAGPQLVWKAEGLGKGYSSAAVANGKVYVTGSVDAIGYISAYDMSGKMLWRKSYGVEYDGDFPGARCTPTIVDKQLYFLTGLGKLVCMDGETGAELWSCDLVKTFGGEVPQWGYVENLLIDGNKVICTPGGAKVSVVALDRMTGKSIWTAESANEITGFCSPTLVQHNKRRLIVTMTAKNIIAVDADAGKLLWKHPHVTEWDINPNTPLYQDGCIYAVSGYGTGGVKLELSPDGSAVKELWQDKMLDCQMGGAVLVNGNIYGSGHYKKKWFCLDWQTGQIKHASTPISPRGTTIYADGMLYCYSEKGEVAIMKPNPEAFTLTSSFLVKEGEDQHWAHLVIAEKKLFVRHGSVLLVYQIAR